MNNYTINVSFTSVAEENLLLKEEIKNAIKIANKLNEEEYIRALNSGIEMSFDIFVSDTKVSVNKGVWNELIGNAVYSSNVIVDTQSIRIKDEGITGIISINVRG